MPKPRRSSSVNPARKKLKLKRVHKHLVGLFAFAAVLLVILNVAVLLTPSHQALATASENVVGWAWSDTGGWLSANNLNSGAGGGFYGINVNVASSMVNGFAWADSQGWVCFGSSCAVAGCAGASLAPSGVAPTAWITGSGSSWTMHGWAMVCSLGAPDGWIGLNNTESGGAAYNVSISGGNFGGFAWHALSTTVGWGWISFTGVSMVPEDTTGVAACHEGADNNLNGLIDCADLSCYHKNDAGHLCPANETQCALVGHINCCGNGSDDDFNGPIDCADASCATDPTYCLAENCSNGVDDNGNLLVDCADVPWCGSNPICIPAWLKTEFGNVYASSGIVGNAPPLNQYNATYCLTSAGNITGFESGTNCKEAGSSQLLSLPTGAGTGGYVSNLGRIDVIGVLSGRYGSVVQINSDADIPDVLDGKVYVYDIDKHAGACPSGDSFYLGSAAEKIFNNSANQPTARGNGLLVIKGCKLRIAHKLSYEAAGVQQYLKNLASFGVLVLSKYSGGTWQSGGEMYVDPSVTQIVGMYFAEKAIYTGTGGHVGDLPLYVYGALVSRDIKLQRWIGSATEGAENVRFDGRGVVNPPPGMQDVTKSLPSLKDTF